MIWKSTYLNQVLDLFPIILNTNTKDCINEVIRVIQKSETINYKGNIDQWENYFSEKLINKKIFAEKTILLINYLIDAKILVKDNDGKYRTNEFICYLYNSKGEKNATRKEPQRN